MAAMRENGITTMKKSTLSIAALAAGCVVAGALTPTSALAEVKGTSDATIVCEHAHRYDPDVYDRPGFVCEIDPDLVAVDGVEHSVVRYELQVRQKGEGIVKSPEFPFGLDPVPVFFGASKLDFDSMYQVDYVATLDDGEVARVTDDEFTLETPKAPARVKPKVRFGALKKGVGTGYTVSWPKTGHTEGYQAKVRTKKDGSWRDLALTAARKAELGRTDRSSAVAFKVRSWNAGGHSKWQKVAG